MKKIHLLNSNANIAFARFSVSFCIVNEWSRLNNRQSINQENEILGSELSKKRLTTCTKK